MLKTVLTCGVASVILAAGWAVPAQAQSEAEFVAAFAGNWQALDPVFSDGGACRITLDPTPVEAGYRLEAANCGGDLADLGRWGIVDNQLGLIRADGEIAARLGGNQQRMNGDTAAGGTVVFERLNTVAGVSPAVPGSAGCIYYGYTASCATPEDLALPQPAGPDAISRAAVLVGLNARTEARTDADIVATIPAGTCVVVNECTSGADGNWCRAQVSNYSGWIRQQTVRRDRWPVLTYAPDC